MFGRVGILTLIVSALMLGCRKTPNQRLPLSGTVTVQSVDIVSGTLRLEPADGRGPSVTANIRDNRFAYGTADGPVAGTYRALIRRASELPERTVDETLDDAMEADRVWILRDVTIRPGQAHLHLSLDGGA